jgi:hypothetical protein
MMYRRMMCLWLLFSAVVLGGCATSRSELRLSTPTAAPAAPLRADAPVAVIRTVRDERRFELAPDDPGVPSLGFEGAEKATAEVKLRAIGRKRNTFGKALGDVLLQEGQTVESLVRDTLASALRENGYNVQGDNAGVAPRLQIDARIRRFWSWIQPGFWAITVKSEIALEVAIAPAAPAIPIAVQLEDPRQIVTEAAWVEAIEKAMQALRSEAMRKLPSGR